MEFLEKLKEIGKTENIVWNIFLYQKRKPTKTNDNPYLIFSCELDSSSIEKSLFTDILNLYNYLYQKEEFNTAKYSPNSSKHTIDFIDILDSTENSTALNENSQHIAKQLNYLNTAIAKAKKYDKNLGPKINGYIIGGIYTTKDINQPSENVTHNLYLIKAGSPVKTLNKNKKIFKNDYKLENFDPERIELSNHIDSLIYSNKCYIVSRIGLSFWNFSQYNTICRNDFINEIKKLDNLITFNYDITKHRPTSNSIYASITDLNENLEDAINQILYKKFNNFDVLELKDIKISSKKIIIDNETDYEILLKYLAFQLLSRDKHLISTSTAKILPID